MTARLWRCAALLLLGALACTRGGRDAASSGDTGPVRVVFVDASDGRGADARAALGATMAAEEAERAGELVGRRFELVRVRAATADAAAREARRALRGDAVAVVGGFDASTCRALDALAVAEQVLYLNVGCDDPALRDASRHPRTFHVAPTAAMRRGAGPGVHGAAPTLWNARLSRYGAAQLNERFARRFGEPMGGEAWAGWMAVKLLAEAALRTRAVAPHHADTLAAYLVRTDVAFDGHKGEPLRFGADDHQLRQPVYLPDGDAAGGRVETDVGAAGDGSAPPGGGPGLPALADSTTPLLVVTNEGSASLTVLDATTHRVAGVIPLGHRPRGAQASADGARVLVALSDAAPNTEGNGDGIVALDPRSGHELARYRAGSDPEQFAIAPDGAHLFAANEDAGLASVTDVRTGALLAQLPVGIEPEGVAVSPDGRWVYVTAETSNTVSVIDTRTNQVTASFLVDVRPRAAAFAPDGRRAYVTNEISGTVSVIDPRRHAVVATIALGEAARPVGVVVAPDGRRVYVASGGTHAVAVIDPAAGRLVGTVPVGRRPWGIAVSPDGRWIYTANGGSGDVSIVDAATLRVAATVPVGERPWGVTFVPGIARRAPTP